MRRLRHALGWPSVVAVAGIVVGMLGCSAGVGTLYPSEIEDAIRVAELSVERARAQDLSLAAKTALSAAEVKLASAKRALDDEDGVAAHAAAQEARVQAENAIALDAQSDAYQRLIREEAQKHDDDAAELASARAEAASTRRAAEAIRSDLRLLRDQLDGFQSNAKDIVGQKAAAERRAQELERDLAASRQSIREMTGILDQARAHQLDTERQVAVLAQQVQGAAASMDETRRREAEALAETRRARELAQAYTDRMQAAGRERARDQALAKARAEGRPPAPTISPEEVLSASPTLKQWKSAWERADMTRHLAFYHADANGERISVRAGQEQRTRITHSQLLDAIRASDPTVWEGVARSATRAEGAHVVAELPYRRRDGAGALYDFWVRKAFWARSGAEWRIVREEWRYYDEVPQFTDR